MIKWENKTNGLIWEFPEKKIFLNEQIVVGKNQVVGIFSGFRLFSHAKLHSICYEGIGSVLPEKTLSRVSELYKGYYDILANCSVIFCSVDKFDFSGKIYGQEWLGAATRHVEANVYCKLRIYDVSLFLKKFVCEKKKKSTEEFVSYLKKVLGEALAGGGKENLNTLLNSFGIDLLDFRYQTLKDECVGFGC